MRQRVLSQAVEQRQHDELVECADDIGTVRLLSLLLPYTGAFLTATPSWDAHVPRKDFQAVVRFRLGVQVYDEGSTCDACLEKQDPWGLHVTGCERRHDRFERHDAVVHAVAAKFNELGIKAKIEVRDIIADTQWWPGDVALPAGVTGKRRVAVDVTIRTPFAASVLRSAATTIGYAASRGREARILRREVQPGGLGLPALRDGGVWRLRRGGGGSRVPLRAVCIAHTVGRRGRPHREGLRAHLGGFPASARRKLQSPGDQYVAAVRTY